MIEHPFCTPEFWRKRIKESKTLRDAIQGVSDWDATLKGHKVILDKFIKGRVFDAGCGYGRIIEYLPDTVTDYVGMDITPEFIEEAKRRYPEHRFKLGDIRRTTFYNKEFDWAIAIGMANDNRPWHEMEKELIRVAKNVLLLWLSKPDKYFIYKDEGTTEEKS